MPTEFMFYLNSILFGFGLAMDAFSVSLADGLAEPRMPRKKVIGIAGVFAVFQGLMPLLGWLCVHTMVSLFSSLSGLIPWVSLLLLSLIGGKMLYGGLRAENVQEEKEPHSLGLLALLLQGVATSIDALSVGFTIADYDLLPALICTALIAMVTFGVCTLGVELGKRFGTRFSHKAEILGGAILIVIGIEIFLTGIF